MDVPASTKVRYTRVGNVDTERLMRRRAHIIATKSEFARAADARIELRQRARELFAIEAELVRRGEMFLADTHLNA
jgi:hypothetical protein